MNRRILCIGGSPCAGKSTVAERISKEYGAYYYKVDDHIDEFINLAAEKGYTTCKNCLVMTPEENWMRPPVMQRDEEFDIYDEMSEFVFDFLDKIDSDFIITEGAAYTPKIIKKYGIQEYITIIPTPEFQISHYKEREYVPYVLEGCSDKQKAFDNWMQRDILFAEYVRSECEKNDIPCIINDGLISKDEMFEKVKKLFGL